MTALRTASEPARYGSLAAHLGQIYFQMISNIQKCPQKAVAMLLFEYLCFLAHGILAQVDMGFLLYCPPKA